MAAVPPRTSLRSSGSSPALRQALAHRRPLAAAQALRVAPLRAARRGAALCEWRPLRHRAAQWASGRGLRQRRRELQLEEATSRG